MGAVSNKRRGKRRETVAKAIGDFAGGLCLGSSNSAGNAEKTRWATGLSESYPGTVEKGVVLAFANEFSGL